MGSPSVSSGGGADHFTLINKLHQEKNIHKVLDQLDAENKKITSRKENLSPKDREFYVGQAKAILNQRRMAAQPTGNIKALHERVQTMHATLDAIKAGNNIEKVKATAKAKLPHSS